MRKLKSTSKHSTELSHPFLSPEDFKRHHIPKLIIGWQEWIQLPKLHLPAIKCKIDTGAKTAALHADNIEVFSRQGERFVHFTVHPLQKNTKIAVSCSAKVIDERTITSSTGGKEHRYIIKTPITLGHLKWEIELSLSNRDSMTFRMLLGRDALRYLFIIDPQKTLCQGKHDLKTIQKWYRKPKKSFFT